MIKPLKLVHFHIPAELHQRLKVYSVVQGRPMQDMMAEALIWYLDSRGSKKNATLDPA